MQKGKKHSGIYFDSEDHDILELINPVISGEKSILNLRNLFDTSLHPRGIKELGALKPLRVASAMFDLINSFEEGTPSERLRALRSVRDEVLQNESQTMQMNTARVLLQIMKSLVRARGDESLQLQLANDFRQATTGKPRLIRKQLKKYHLLEMPEDWSQHSFDHHVHDANSKGRKSPTHLIMDAWIKGIRELVVIYYDYIRIEAAAELLEAAEIMGVNVRIGVEIPAMLRNKPVQLIWAPRGFNSREDFMTFLELTSTIKFLDLGREVAEYKHRMLETELQNFNKKHLKSINEMYGISLKPLSVKSFNDFVGDSQTSQLHLADFIHANLMTQMTKRAAVLLEEKKKATPERAENIELLLDDMDSLVSEAIVERYLESTELIIPENIENKTELPELLRYDIDELLERMREVPRGSRVILNPSNLTSAEVLEVLYAGKGMISYIELFNLKDWAENDTRYREQICQIRKVINSGNITQAKRLILEIIHDAEEEDEPCTESIKSLKNILVNIKKLQGYYSRHHLKSRIGSDSTGRSRHSRGMGLIVEQSLSSATRKIIRDENRMLPLKTQINRQVTYVKRRSPGLIMNGVYDFVSKIPFLETLAYNKTVDWKRVPNSTILSERGNIASLGGIPEETSNGFRDVLKVHEKSSENISGVPPFRYINSTTKNLLKVLIGFIPAFLTFYLTKDWWFFAWFGAIIWFSITGFRNVVQSVFGGGGIFRSSLLRWKDLISWNRISDSLLFTGFSVPLLDYLVKTIILAQMLDITTTTNPMMLYTSMALANGIYISSHNTFRGLPPAAIVGNFFRTVLSIPIAILLNYLVEELLLTSGMPVNEVFGVLQLWAAVISKTASDMVAGIIEGTADRSKNIAMRDMDFNDKYSAFQELQDSLEMFFPQDEVSQMLEDPKTFFRMLKGKNYTLLKRTAINVLDCMYIWMYQPRGRYVFYRKLKELPDHEKQFFLSIQRVLSMKKELSAMFIEGLVGKRFDKALASYLNLSRKYLDDMEKILSS